MKGWNPFGKVDMEIGSFIKASPFNKEYGWGKSDESDRTERTDKKGK
ncbi:hypothetical protein CLHUN_08450 [Ruminiclostridium hungatei]|uniref:Uncharacterized protein n=1 Tax=Ruminiclostridium hungatei TaxID=48256 RepID=A0A1V4SPS7_RUMHU|nr:hypothetical protein [Ruminiclostridium hungatei]OPX45475.1 hypothetical protein CLHUN_08450 [Ruminiclostridium hungatei]